MITTPLYNAAAWRVSGPDRAVALRTMFQLLRLELAFGIIAAIGGLVFAPFVIQIVSGSAYAEAAGPLAILIVGAAALPMWGAVGLYVLAHLGGAWTTARLQLLVAAGSAVGYVVLVPVAGMIGAAAVSTLAYLVLLGTGLALIRRVTPFALRDLAPTPEIARVRAMLGRGRIAGAPSDEGSGEDPAS